MSDENVLALEGEAGFKALFEYATVGILAISSGGRIELANPFIKRLFGYQTRELIGQLIEVPMPEAFRQKQVNHRDNYFNKPRALPKGPSIPSNSLKISANEEDTYH